MENGAPPALGASSPSPNLVGPGGPFGCSQCTTSFATKDQLEKHELLHSPNAQVVSGDFFVNLVECCKNGNTAVEVRCRFFEVDHF